MGLLGSLFDKALDVVVDAPGDVVKATTKTVARLPEVGIKTVAGAVKGLEEGVESVSKAAEDALK